MMRKTIVTALFLAACTDSNEQASSTDPETGATPETISSPVQASRPNGRAIDGPALILAQAQFTWEEKDGKRSPQPGAAKLRIFHYENGSFSESILEDEDSRVFHKAMCVDLPGLKGLVTIGASAAHLKVWNFRAGRWQAKTLWTGEFGGTLNRLRDMEIGDVDHDGQDEIVIATHDQGVVAVLDRPGTRWIATEIYSRPDTFVHEVEIGDVDGDGLKEIYATPSKPNRANASQPGDIVSLAYNKKRQAWSHHKVARFENSHAKEILVTDLDGDGKDELYAAVEASLKPENGKLSVSQPVKVVRYSAKRSKKFGTRHETVAEFPAGLQSRVLLAADLTHSNQRELVATTMKDGIWRIKPLKNGRFETQHVDKQSGGFEHAAFVTDLDGDSKAELYVTSDDDDEFRRYVWNGTRFEKTVLAQLEKSDLVWNITACD